MESVIIFLFFCFCFPREGIHWRIKPYTIMHVAYRDRQKDHVLFVFKLHLEAGRFVAGSTF